MREYLERYVKPVSLMLVIFVALYIVWTAALHAMLEKNTIAQKIAKSLESISGYEVNISDVSIATTPNPRIVLKGVGIKNSPLATHDYLLWIDSVSINFDFMDLLSGKNRIISIAINSPQLAIETYADNSKNWNKLLQADIGLLEEISELPVYVFNGAASYNDAKTRKHTEIDSLFGLLFYNKTNLKINANFKKDNLPNKFVTNSTIKEFDNLSKFLLSGELNYTQSNDNFSFKGDWGVDVGTPILSGVTEISLVDVLPWVDSFLGKENLSSSIFTSPIGFNLVSEIRSDISSTAINSLTIMLGKNKAIGQITRQGQAYSVKLNFDKLQIPENIFANKRSLSVLMGGLLPPDKQIDLDLRVQKIEFPWAKDAGAGILQATLDGGEMIINQASIALSGNTTLAAFGMLHRQANLAVSGGNEISFDGSAEIFGDNFKDFLASTAMAKFYPFINHEGKFRARTTLFLSPQQATLSNGRFQAGQVQLKGGANINYSNNPSTEANLTIDGGELDSIANAFLPSLATNGQAGDADYTGAVRKLDWLENVAHPYSFNLSFINYKLLDAKGIAANFILKLDKNHFSLDKLTFDYNEHTGGGILDYAQTSDKPLLRANLQLSDVQINSDNLRKDNIARENIDNIWSQAPIHADFMKGYDANIKLLINQFSFNQLNIDNLNLTAKSDKNNWEINSDKLAIFGGEGNFKLLLSIWANTTISFVFNLKDVMSEQLLQALEIKPAISGKIGLNGKISSAGLNLSDLVKQANGNFLIAGRDITIHNIDIVALEAIMPQVRSVAEVVNLVRVKSLQGKTSFSEVSGSFSAANGWLKSSGIAVKYNGVNGKISGVIDMEHWLMQMIMDFVLQKLSTAQPPVARITVNGSIDNPLLGVDTRSLEAFVARGKQ